MTSLKKLKLTIRTKFDSYFPNISMGDNPAPLHLAIMFKNFEAVVRIVDKNGKLDLLWRGITPVTRALDQKALNILEYLVKHGASVNIRTKDHRMEPPLFTACRLNQVQAAKILLQSPSVDVNQKDFFNYSALWAAAIKASNLELVTLLLDHGADINIGRGTPNTLTCFLFRPSQWKKDIIHLLIRRGMKLFFPKVLVCTLLLESLRFNDPLTFALIFRAEFLPLHSYEPIGFDYTREWKENDYLRKFISCVKIGPQPLENLTVDLIRKTLVKHHKNIIPAHVQKLPLPNYLKKKILFEDIV